MSIVSPIPSVVGMIAAAQMAKINSRLRPKTCFVCRLPILPAQGYRSVESLGHAHATCLDPAKPSSGADDAQGPQAIPS